MQEQKKFVPIIFSSDESMASDYSFLSSDEEQIYNNKITVKDQAFVINEQMNNFFLENPHVDPELNFDQDANVKQINENNGDNKGTGCNIPKYWKRMSKNILKNSSNGIPPQLDAINLRLNVYLAENEEIDHLKVLTDDFQKNTSKSKNKLTDRQKNKKDKQEKQQVNLFLLNRLNNHQLNECIRKININSVNVQLIQLNAFETFITYLPNKYFDLYQMIQENTVKLPDEPKEPLAWGHVQYFSERKKYWYNFKQQSLKQQQTIQKVIVKNNQKQDIDSEEMQTQKTRQNIFERLFKNQTNDNTQDDQNDIFNFDFKSQAGQILYQNLLDSKGDIEEFKHKAIFFLTNHNKKTKDEIAKLKSIPPSFDQFTDIQNKKLNFLMPDYNISQQIDKEKLMQQISEFQLNPNSIEYVFIETVYKLLNGDIIDYWKNSHTQQKDF